MTRPTAIQIDRWIRRTVGAVRLCGNRPQPEQRSYCNANSAAPCDHCHKPYGSVFRWKRRQHEPNPVGLANYLGCKIARRAREQKWTDVYVRYTSGGPENNELLWDVSVLRKRSCSELQLFTAPLLACEVQAERGAGAFGKMLSKIILAHAELRAFLYVRSDSNDMTPRDVIKIVRRFESKACKKTRLLIGRASYLDGPNRRANPCEPSCARSVRWDWASDPPER